MSKQKKSLTGERTGVRTRLGRPVQDALEPLSMPLTKRDISIAKRKRRRYAVDDPANFQSCALATCLSKIAGADVEIHRRHAYVALPDEAFTRRYEVSPKSTEIVHLNDEDRFDEIPPNVMIELRAPSPRRRLGVQRANAKAKDNYKATRGSGRKQQGVDPYRGVWRSGNAAPRAAD